MRRAFTTQEAHGNGFTHSALKWGVRQGSVQRIMRGVYLEGSEPPTPLERAVAVVVATNGIASGSLAGKLYGLDGVRLEPPFATIPPTSDSRHRVRRADVVPVLIQGVPSTDGLQTIEDLAAVLSDIRWEQAMESALRKRLVTIEQLETSKHKRVQRVMALRPSGAPPTESLLETMAVQLIRTEPSLPAPSRQVVVLNKWDRFVARVDLAWPEYGIFLELDGSGHQDQPVYDAHRQTAVIAATGWLVGRFTWHEILELPTQTVWRLRELFEQASRLRLT